MAQKSTYLTNNDKSPVRPMSSALFWILWGAPFLRAQDLSLDVEEAFFSNWLLTPSTNQGYSNLSSFPSQKPRDLFAISKTICPQTPAYTEQQGPHGEHSSILFSMYSHLCSAKLAKIFQVEGTPIPPPLLPL